MTKNAHPTLSDEPDLDRLRRAQRLKLKDPKMALSEFHALAEQGSVLSMIFLGHSYQFGHGTKVDLNEAEQWFRRAADRGSLRGYYFLGALYHRQQRYKEAAEAFQYAANERYVAAIHLLGFMYLQGKGVALDEQKGEILLRRAAAAGNVFAKARLAHLLMRRRRGGGIVLQGIRFQIEAIFQFFAVVFTEGLGSERLR